jgi:hypothetical protein
VHCCDGLYGLALQYQYPGSLPDIYYTAEEMHKNIKSFGAMKNFTMYLRLSPIPIYCWLVTYQLAGRMLLITHMVFSTSK